MSASTWKRDFASGLIVLLPIIVTLYIITYLYGLLAAAPFLVVINERLLTDILPGRFVTEETVTFVRVLMSLIVFVLLVFSVGYLMRTAFGNVVEAALDDAMNRLPGLRVVYNASKMAVETAVGGKSDLQSPVKIETWGDMRMTAFKTGQKAPDGRDVIFLPTAPNITTGFVLEVDESEYEEIDESVEDALTRILSAGFGEANESEMPLEQFDIAGQQSKTDGPDEE